MTQLEKSVELIMQAIRESNQDKAALLKQLKKANKVLEAKVAMKRRVAV